MLPLGSGFRVQDAGLVGFRVQNLRYSGRVYGREALAPSVPRLIEFVLFRRR